MEKIVIHNTGCVCSLFNEFWSSVVTIDYSEYIKHWQAGDYNIPCNCSLNLIKRFRDEVANSVYGLVEDPVSSQVWIVQLSNCEDCFVIERENTEDYNYNTEGAQTRCRKLIRYTVDDVEYVNKYEALMHFNFTECLKLLGEKNFYPIASFNSVMKEYGVTYFGLANILQNTYTNESCFYYNGELVVFYHIDDAILRALDENFANLNVLDDYANKVFANF